MSIPLEVARIVDFNTALPSTNMMKALYAGTVGARVSAARSKEEIREVATRDIPGWLTFFYGAAIVQNVVGYALDMLTETAKGGTALVKGPSTGKKFIQMLNPFTKYKVRSFDDIKALEKVIDPKNYKDLMRNKSIVFMVGMAASIAVLGLFIPWLNVQITRKQIMNSGQGGDNKSQIKFSPNVNLTPDPNFKSSFNRYA